MVEQAKQAKASLKTEVGVIEIEGSEDFVKNGIVDLIKQIKTNNETDIPVHKKIRNQPSGKSPRMKVKRTKNSGGISQPKLIPDLLPKEKIENLRNFFQEKTPGNHQEAFAIIAYWLKYNLDLENVSIDEEWTVHKIIDRKGPINWIQVFRDAKSKKGWFDSVPDQEGRYSITVMGETLVEHDLPSVKK